MPIIDYDGTTYYDINKVSDHDGTTYYQIGKVYDNDGTTSSLIYSAEETLLSTETSVSTGSAKASNIGLSVDLTNYSTLYITAKTSGTSGKHNWWVGVFKSQKTKVAYADMTSNYVKGTTNTPSGSLSKTTITVDVSDLSGTYFVGLGVHSATNYSASGTLYSIIAE